MKTSKIIVLFLGIFLFFSCKKSSNFDSDATKFKDYFSSLGIKQSKRQCTPLKLNRYIKVLNYLHQDGPLREF